MPKDKVANMAADVAPEQSTDTTIEDLAKALGYPDWALAGAKVRYGWGAGKRLSEAEFRKKIEAWLSGPASGEVR